MVRVFVTPKSYCLCMEGYDQFPTDELECRLVAGERLIAQIRADQADIIGALDQRQVPLADGCRSLNEWVAGRLDVSSQTASIIVATGRRLVDQPKLSKALHEGKTSFDRAVALARVAGDPDEYDHLGIPGLHRLATRQDLTGERERSVFEGRHLTMQPTLDQSRWRLSGDLPGHDGAIIQEALFAKADSFPSESRRDGQGARQADALTAICLDSLTGGSEEVQSRPEGGVTVFVDTRLGPNGYIPGGPAIGPNTLHELLCTGAVEPIGLTESGMPLNIGRRSAKIPPRLRRAVIGRDGGCVSSGCHSRYRLQVHHVVHWEDGGLTDADNLVTLCWFHHHVVIHQRGFRIDPSSPRQRIRFLRPLVRAPDYG